MKEVSPEKKFCNTLTFQVSIRMKDEKEPLRDEVDLLQDGMISTNRDRRKTIEEHYEVWRARAWRKEYPIILTQQGV